MSKPDRIRILINIMFTEAQWFIMFAQLENPGKLPLTLIEVQTGSYFGEDDIIRYDDLYARG